MKPEFKIQLSEAVKNWVIPGNNERSQNALATKTGVSAGTISLIKNGKFENNGSPIGDEHFLLLAKFFGLNVEDAQPSAITLLNGVQTANCIKIQQVCALAQRQKRHFLLIGDSGVSKSYGLELYAKKDRVMYMRCKSIMNMKDLLIEIMNGLKIQSENKRVNQWLNEIEVRLVAQPGWLLIFDETEDLPDSIWRAIKELIDSFKGKCAIVVAGIELHLMLGRKADKSKPGFRQLKRRLFPNQVHLSKVGKSQIRDVLTQIGISEAPGLIQWLTLRVSDYQMLFQYLSDALQLAEGEPLNATLMDELFTI